MHCIALPDQTEACEVALRLAASPGLLWVDGGGGFGSQGRWSFLGSNPAEVLSVPYGVTEPLSVFSRLEPTENRPSAIQGAPLPGEVPHWAGYVAYDAHWSGRSCRRLACTSVPILWLARYEALVAIDHWGQRAFVVGDHQTACERLLAGLNRRPQAPVAQVGPVLWEDRAVHAAAIRAALAHIAAGDIYQVNLARCWTASYRGSPLALWLPMRDVSPVPLGLFVDAGDHAVLARTMERFVHWRGPGGKLVSRPIKGTLARTGLRDRAEAHRLQNDEKERAEHIMIIDLMRNDLGRVAQLGSVRVTGIMEVERYAGLSHLVSTVSCLTRPEVSLQDVMEATFPPGSVTGAPKLRAIEIIEDLERVARGIYTGAVGYVDRAGGASWAVAIRTAVISRASVRYLAGGGLVAASDVEREIAETELKARVFLDAVSAVAQPHETRVIDPVLVQDRLRVDAVGDIGGDQIGTARA